MNLCYTIIEGKPAGMNVGIIKEGMGGYNLTDYDWGVGDGARETARWLNDKHGISKEVQMEYEIKSMFVWQ